MEKIEHTCKVVTEKMLECVILLFVVGLCSVQHQNWNSREWGIEQNYVA
jgi:hypothetical protein